MTDTAKKTSELATANTAAGSDRLVFLYQANSSAPSTRTITVNNFANSIALSRLKNANASLSMDNTGILTVSIGNTVGYIGDAENTNGLDLYASASDNAAWVSLTYSVSGNDATGSNTAYAWLQTSNAEQGSAYFGVTLPANSMFGYSWYFDGSDGTLMFPDYTKQTTAYNISGPYADDTAAAAAGVALNALYYTADGSVKIRLT